MKSEILNKEFKYSVNHYGLKSDENFWVHDKFLVTIEDQSFEYSMGIGNRNSVNIIGNRNGKEFKRLINMIPKKTASNINYYIQELKKVSVHQTPKIDDVLYSIVMDSMAVYETFEDWCMNLGYDTDSRKALETYLLCQENGNKLTKLGININEAIELFKDY